MSLFLCPVGLAKSSTNLISLSSVYVFLFSLHTGRDPQAQGFILYVTLYGLEYTKGRDLAQSEFFSSHFLIEKIITN